jgi:hypothetical protein
MEALSFYLYDKLIFMDFQLEDRQDAGIEKLRYYHQICNDALNDFSTNHPYQLAEYEKEKIVVILHRLFYGEIDYLEKSPDDYFKLYKED